MRAGRPPRVSVVVAVYNARPTLARCLDSVLAQTHADTELIVIDGGSTDGSVDVIRARADRLAYWESSPDRGIYHAWNKALARATGDWVYFLGGDDYLVAPDVLARMAGPLADAAGTTRVVYGRVQVIDEADRALEVRGRPWAELREEFRHQLTLPHQGVFHHRALFAERTFDESFRISGDYELLLGEVFARPPRFVPDVVVAAWTLGGVSSRPDFARRLVRENHRALALHGMAPGVVERRWSLAKVGLRSALVRLGGDATMLRVATWWRRLRGRPGLALER